MCAVGHAQGRLLAVRQGAPRCGIRRQRACAEEECVDVLPLLAARLLGLFVC